MERTRKKIEKIVNMIYKVDRKRYGRESRRGVSPHCRNENMADLDFKFAKVLMDNYDQIPSMRGKLKDCAIEYGETAILGLCKVLSRILGC